MPSVTLEEAQARLPELIARLSPGEELVITKDDQPIVRLVGVTRRRKGPRRAGTMIGHLKIIEDDQEDRRSAESPESDNLREPGAIAGKVIVLSEDDGYLEDFKEYMPSEGATELHDEHN